MRERLFQREPGGVWYCWYYAPDGRRVKKSTKCLDRKSALLACRRLEREAHDPANHAANAPTYTIAQALEHLVNRGSRIADATLGMYLQKAGHLKRLVGTLSINQISGTETMQTYITTR